MAQIAVPPGEGTERSRIYNHGPAMVPGIQGFNSAVYQHSQLALRELETLRYTVALINQCPI